VTHAMSGFVLASPFVTTQPVAASTFMCASVAPDLDVLSRLCGKRAFLKAHQTWSHALPLIALAGGALHLLTDLPPTVPAALVAGMALHALLDWTNTYGITLWAPFRQRRVCAEWVFFVDAFVLLLSATATALVALTWPAAAWPAVVYGALLVAYICLKGWLRRRALGRCPPGTLALLPSALYPWRWFGCRREGGRVHLFQVDGRIREERTVHVLPADAVREVPEFRIMRELSPAYHVVERDGDRIVCRDLRTRHFGARFGTLQVRLEPDGPRVVHFDV
ncbi:MAG: metal-dependent hydrolase, partial [Planctomycetota bacterium]